MTQIYQNGRWIDDSALTPGQFSNYPIATPIPGRIPGEQGFEITGGGRITSPTPAASTSPAYRPQQQTVSNPMVVQTEQRDANGLLINPAGALFDRNTGKPINQTITTPAPVGSVTDVYNSLGYSDEEQGILDDYYAGRNKEFDPNAVYKQNLQMYQAQIDAINNIYQDQLNRSRIENAPEFQAREQTTGIVAANQGLTGSNIGSSMVNATTQLNSKQQASEDAVFAAQRNDSIARIYGQVADSVTAARKSFEETKLKTNEEYIASIKAKPEERKKQVSNAVKLLLAQGIDVNTMTPEELKMFADKIGVNPDVIKGEYAVQAGEAEASQAEAQAKADKAALDARKTEADIAQTEKETSLLGQMTPYQRAQLEQTASENKMTGPEYIRTSAQEMGNILAESLDTNGFLTPSQYKQAKTKWVNESGLTPEQFDSYFSDKAYTEDVDKESPYTIQSYGISKKGTNALPVQAE